jgi:Kelch motif
VNHKGRLAFGEILPTFLNVARGGLANATAGGRIHAIGGWTSDFATHSPVSRHINPGPAHGSWWPLCSPRVAALGGRIFVVGGGTNNATVNSVHVYNPQTDTFSDAAPMPTARQLLKATELGGRLYAIGGVNDTGFLATVERYTPATDTWETVTPMSTPRGNPGVVSAAGRIFVVGGASDVYGSVVPLQSSEVFDPNTNTWQPVDALLPVGRGSLSAERGPGNVILAFGGFESGVTASARVEALPISQLWAVPALLRAQDPWQAWTEPVRGRQCGQVVIRPGGRVLATAVAATSSAFRRPTSSRTYALATPPRSGRALVDLVVVSELPAVKLPGHLPPELCLCLSVDDRGCHRCSLAAAPLLPRRVRHGRSWSCACPGM